MMLTILVLTALMALAYGFLVGVFVAGRSSQPRARNRRHSTQIPLHKPRR